MHKKIKSFKQVCKICKNLQNKGKKIVFVHGVFDILHRGHVTLLREAKKLGDVLVVGVDHDDNARILKGPKRPINDHESRIFILSSIEYVDLVFLIPSFKGKTGGEIYEFYQEFCLELRPDIVATSIKAGKHGYLEKKNAEASGAKFVDIDHGIYGKNTSKIIKLLGLE